MKRCFVVLLLLGFFLAPKPAIPGDRFRLRETEISTGRGTASIDNGPYQFIPLYVSFCYEIKPVERALHAGGKTTFEGILEPMASYVTSPYDNAEFGFSLLARVKRMLTDNLSLFFTGGVGALYTTQHTHEEGSQYLFTPQLGCGIQICLRKGLALVLQYRFRHMSNAGLEEPNSGINAHIGLIGISMVH